MFPLLSQYKNRLYPHQYDHLENHCSMGNTDSIPVVSQVKSLVQVIGGDEKGALKTQENFQRTGPIASQINSLVHHIKVRSCPKINSKC